MALIAGLVIKSTKRVGIGLLAVAATISFWDTGSRVSEKLKMIDGLAPDLRLGQGITYQQMMMEFLPYQIMASIVFQMAVPFAVGFVLAWVAFKLQTPFDRLNAQFGRRS